MDNLPSSIETYLEEAGFSGTEILILRRLMEGEPLTIRQLGAKTGKSTGVLDQAMKKLMKKNIIKRATINDTPKYSLDSLEAVVEWMQEDMESKRDLLLRRHQNFESFVSSLENGSKRPDIEYFEDQSGIKQAYIKLLNGPGEILHYLPVKTKEEDDPLRDFRVQYFRERQQRKMFSRVLAHDTPLGRRYQSRDMFEYRKTVLVPESEYPFSFEKIITGDRIACLDHVAKTACVIRYPELADIERTLFDAIWKQVQKPPTVPEDASNEHRAQARERKEPDHETIARSTAALSRIREFFLSPKSLIAFGVCALLAASATGAVYWYNLSLNKVRIQERVKSIAATAALQFDAKDVDQIHIAADIEKPEYAKLIHHLNRIRRENDGVKYAYILRPTHEIGTHRFVADADSINPYLTRDTNEDGIIDDADHLSLPGEIYREQDLGPDQFFKMEESAFYDPGTDQWGTFITGTAPIRDQNGSAIALIGVDIEADRLYRLTNTQFQFFAYFFAFFLLFAVVRFAAFNRALLIEFSELLRVRRTLLIILLCGLITISVSLTLYIFQIRERTELARVRIASIATVGSLSFTAEELQPLQTFEDIHSERYQSIVRKLYDLRARNDEILYAYLIRPVSNSTTFAFIADADAFGRDLRAQNDVNNDGLVTDADEVGYPGLPYDISHIEVLRERQYHTPITEYKPYRDKWGFVLSGYAPIRDASESVVALLAIDSNAWSIYVPSWAAMMPILLFLAALASYLLLRKSGLARSPIYVLARTVRRKWLYTAAFGLMIVYWAAFGFLYYRQQLIQDEIGKRLMAIAATTASEFDPNDLEKLRFAKDMKTEEYQRVFKKLNDIRSKNPEIKWIYILRPTEQEGLWEFVADADSNYFLDNADDYNADDQFSPDEVNVWPGMSYYHEGGVLFDALARPAFSKEPETDQWGTYITGATPIRDFSGKTVAIIGMDIEIND